MAATLLEFARVNDLAANTPRKLEKERVLAEYFRGLDEADLRLAVRYTAGRPFAPTDERVLNVGWSTLADAVLPMLGLGPADYHQLVIRNGEIGEALSRAWPAGETNHPLTLRELSRMFDELAAIGGSEPKRRLLAELFARCASPREAAYAAKIIFRELRTGVREGVLRGAIARAFDEDLSRVRRAQFLLGDPEQVAVLAREHRLDSARLRLFHPIEFMLATPQDSPELAAEAMGGRTFLAEDKLDGIRAQLHTSAGRIVLYTRTLDRADESFPDVVEPLAKLPGELLLDGEIVPYRDGRVLPFAHIQRRLGRKTITPKVVRDNPAVFIAFDVLFRDGLLLMDEPLHERRKALAELTGAGQSPLMMTSAVPVESSDEIARAFDTARGRGNEGIVLKDPDSLYSPGRRGQWWLKLKTHLPTFDCVVTAAEYGHGKRRQVLSDYTFAVWDRPPDSPAARLVPVGKAFTGLTDVEIAELTELFLRLSVGQSGRVHRVRPQVVLEIAADQIQRSERHASGYAMRFPRILRIRWDKRPEDADTLRRVAEVYESGENFGRSLAHPSPREPTLFD